MTDTSPQQVLERLLASADARGADVARACLHPDVDFSAPGVSGDADSLLAWMSPLMAAASHLHHQVVSAASAGDNAAAELATTVSFDPTDGPGSNLLRACNVWRCCAPDPTRPATTWPGRPAARPTPTSGPANGTACGPGRARPRPGMTGELDAAGGRGAARAARLPRPGRPGCWWRRCGGRRQHRHAAARSPGPSRVRGARRGPITSRRSTRAGRRRQVRRRPSPLPFRILRRKRRLLLRQLGVAGPHRGVRLLLRRNLATSLLKLPLAGPQLALGTHPRQQQQRGYNDHRDDDDRHDDTPVSMTGPPLPVGVVRVRASCRSGYDVMCRWSASRSPRSLE